MKSNASDFAREYSPQGVDHTAKYDPERAAHQAWLGLLQPVGLVVSPPALIKAQAVVDRHVAPVQQALFSVVHQHPPALSAAFTAGEPALRDLPGLFSRVLGWDDDCLVPFADLPEPLAAQASVDLRDYNDTLYPDFVVLDTQAGDDPRDQLLMLVQWLPHDPHAPVAQPTIDLDAVAHDPGPGQPGPRGWQTSPHTRFERLLRHTGMATGLLISPHQVRLLYAPRGESAGHIDFPIAEMCTVPGRPILAAMHMLLAEYRVFGAADGQRLSHILADSRSYQSEVSIRLAEQVQGALWQLLAGFEAADEAAHGRLLADLSATDPDHIYGGLLTVIMRLVFLLYAEDQGLLPDHPLYADNYAVGGLYKRLREDAGHHPDTMDQRFGAWAGLLSTFRLIHDGGGHGPLQLPSRHGQLFNPDEYAFLEGRPPGVARVLGDRFDAPRISDGVIWRVLEGLLMLDGERLSYRALDVEQIGSVYEAMMGFAVERAAGRSIGVRRRKKAMNLDIIIDLDRLLALPAAARKKHLAAETEFTITGKDATALQQARTPEQIAAAIGRRLSPFTPHILPAGALYLQPTEERRRSGSHYTPRELTEPIVRTTLAPIIENLGPRPSAEQILALKVCDPAMGSGAFLVESCRQLAEHLAAAWQRADRLSEAPDAAGPDDTLLHARRLVAQACLYGVDKNPFAVSLAKLSLWLVTLARDHAFTFLDHALKHGDSLVGLSREAIGAFHWQPPQQDFGPLFDGVRASVTQAGGYRAEMHQYDPGAYDDRRLAWRAAEDVLHETRLIADLCVAAFFAEDKDKAREQRRRLYRQLVERSRAGDAAARAEMSAIVADLRTGPRGVPAFHWDIEFPEVFERPAGGFDAMVGNPPFAGKNTIIDGNRPNILDWFKHLHQESHGNADLCAHFFRRAFSLSSNTGAFGLIATNTIAQGDTRSTGLRWICLHGGHIYHATRRVKWPGMAAVVVSVVHVMRIAPRQCLLDDQVVPRITAFLFHAGGHDNPRILAANAGKSFQGSIILGMGFTFDDTDNKGAASSIAEMHELSARDPSNAERIAPYIGGQEINTSPTHAHHRYVINFGDMSEDEARQWPDLMAIVEAKVKPERIKQKDRGAKAAWWLFIRSRPELHRAIEGLPRVLAIARVGQHGLFTYLPTDQVFSEQLIVFPLHTHAALCALQSRVHELWARFFASSLEDRLRYTPSDCFETFPFPDNWQTDPILEAAGQTYHEFRAALMIANHQGLTETYNRFHAPDEFDPDILELRRLHSAMDRAVLDAYGWQDIATECQFLLDYEIDDQDQHARKKKPWRYRWPEPVHDQVLARLLELNQTRYQDEQGAGRQAQKPRKPKRAPKPAAKRKPKTTRQPRAPGGTIPLFTDES